MEAIYTTVKTNEAVKTLENADQWHATESERVQRERRAQEEQEEVAKKEKQETKEEQKEAKEEGERSTVEQSQPRT